MPAHELLAYILATITVISLPVLALVGWQLRRDIRFLRALYGALLNLIVRSMEKLPEGLVRDLARDLADDMRATLPPGTIPPVRDASEGEAPSTEIHPVDS